MQIYISRDGEQNGPYGIEDINACLENGTLLPTDLACQDGMTEWVPISQIPGVTMHGDPVPAPAPPSEPMPIGNKKKILIGIGAGMGLLALVAGIWFFLVRERGEKTEKEITIDQSSFSKVYPAVFFSPLDGDISPIVEGEKPPAEKFEIWIEPNDPEVAFGIGQDSEQCGFIHLGNGLDTFNKTSESKLNSIGPDKSGDRKISREMITSEDQPVFLVKGRNSRSIIIILSCDPEAQKIQFKWKLIKADTQETPSKGDGKNSTSEKPTKELTKEDVVGSYEAGLGGITFRFVLLESGVVENYFNGQKEPEDAKWKIQGAEVHIEKGKSDGTVIVNKIEPNGDFTVFARIRNGKREAFQNRTYKKSQDRSEAPKTFSEIDTLLRNRKEKSKSDFETVKRYLSSGVDVNRRNKFGGIILHIAAVQGDKRLVSLLLSKGAKVNAKNNIGKTPLDLAIDLKQTETIALLRKYGANTSAELKAEGKAVKELTLEENIIGTYELKIDKDTTRLVFQKNGVVETYSIERQVKKLEADGKWKMVDGKIHVEESEEGKSWVKVYRINKGGSITYISYIMGAERRDWPKEHQDTYKKIK